MSVTVELRKGAMEAVAVLGEGVADAASAAEAVHAQMVALGVESPPDKKVIEEAIANSGLKGEVVVARGIPPHTGIGAQIFPSFPVKETPIGDDLDLFDAYWRNIAYPGDIILRKTPASEGIPGRNLLGVPLTGSRGPDTPVYSDGGVIEDASGQIYKSNTYGVITMAGGRLSVHEALSVDEDRMNALLTILPDPSIEETQQLEKIVTALRDLNIVRGVDREAISKAVKAANASSAPVHDVLVAKGEPAVDGHEAEYRVVIDLELKALKVLDGDKVDYREKDTVKNVRQGEVIAEVVQATKPVPGYRIDGAAINPKALHVQTLKPGAGVVPNPDGTLILAEVDGMVVVKAGKFNVVSEYVIPGDVDIKTGNIHAAGFVKINGNVQAGFVVDAGRDLTVGGDVWEGTVECGGDIKVFGAITAKSRVVCKGDVEARFVQDSYVECEGDVNVALNITASEIYSKGKCRVMGSQGLIMGGVISATMGIEAKTIGSHGARTSLSVGLDLRVIRELESIRKALPGLQEDLQRLHSSLGKEFLRDPQKALLALPPVLRKNKLDVLKSMKEIQLKTAGLTARQEELEAEIREQKEAVIIVHGEIYAGTEVRIGRVFGTIHENLRRVTIHVDKDNNCVAYRKM